MDPRGGPDEYDVYGGYGGQNFGGYEEDRFGEDYMYGEEDGGENGAYYEGPPFGYEDDYDDGYYSRGRGGYGWGW